MTEKSKYFAPRAGKLQLGNTSQLTVFIHVTFDRLLSCMRFANMCDNLFETEGFLHPELRLTGSRWQADRPY